jgi:hypothetical protein
MLAGILPEVDILQVIDIWTMLTQDDYLDARLLSPEQFSSESLMLLADISAELLQILLAVDDQPPVIERLIISDIELANDGFDSERFKLPLDSCHFPLMLTGVNLDHH